MKGLEGPLPWQQMLQIQYIVRKAYTGRYNEKPFVDKDCRSLFRGPRASQVNMQSWCVKYAPFGCVKYAPFGCVKEPFFGGCLASSPFFGDRWLKYHPVPEDLDNIFKLSVLPNSVSVFWQTSVKGVCWKTFVWSAGAFQQVGVTVTPPFRAAV